MNANPFSSPERIDVISKPKRRSGFTIVEAFICLCFFGLFVGVVVAFFLPTVRFAREPARHTQCKNNLKQIGLALHNYKDAYKAFPPAYTVDANGNPLHSWRTLILPFLDQKPLYDTIDLSKPWDDPANAKAYATSIHAYHCPSDTGLKTSTAYMACVGSDRFFLPTTSRKPSEITDSPAETLMVIEIETESPVHWMSPVDADETVFLSFGPKTKTRHSGGIVALFADGHIQSVNADMPVSERLSLLSINDSKK